MPISQSSVFPSSLKSLTLAAGGTIALAPGVIMSVFAQGSGSKVTYVQMDKSVTFAIVTETPAQVAAGTTLIPVTPNNGNPAKYIRSETIYKVEERSFGSRLQLLSDDSGSQNAASLDVTETVAEIEALVAVASTSLVVASAAQYTAVQDLADAPYITTQYAYVAVPTSLYNIKLGALAVPPSASPVTVTNLNVANILNVNTEASGGFLNFDGQLLAVTVAIQGREAYEFVYEPSVDAYYVRKVVNETEAYVATAAATPNNNQAGGTVIWRAVTYVNTVATDGNACTLFEDTTSISAGLLGARRRIVANTSGAGKYFTLYPPSGGTINGLAANAGINVPDGTVLEVVTVDGANFKACVLRQGTQSTSAGPATPTLANSTPIISSTVHAITVAANGRGFSLSTLSPRTVTFYNDHASNSVTLFAPTSVNGSASITVTPGLGLVLSSVDGLVWTIDRILPIKVAVTLVAGVGTINSSNIGALAASLITATSVATPSSRSALNATPAMAVAFLQTQSAGTSITLTGYAAAGTALNTDVSTVNVIVNL